MEGLLKIILKDLEEAWASITAIDFAVESMETEPQPLQVLDPGEAFVATGIEIRIGGTVRMMDLAVPSLIIKMSPTSDIGGLDLDSGGVGDVAKPKHQRSI